MNDQAQPVLTPEQETKLAQLSNPSAAILNLMNECAEVGMESKMIVLCATRAIQNFATDREEPSLMTKAMADLLNSVEKDLTSKSEMIKKLSAK